MTCVISAWPATTPFDDGENPAGVRSRMAAVYDRETYQHETDLENYVGEGRAPHDQADTHSDPGELDMPYASSDALRAFVCTVSRMNTCTP